MTPLNRSILTTGVILVVLVAGLLAYPPLRFFITSQIFSPTIERTLDRKMILDVPDDAEPGSHDFVISWQDPSDGSVIATGETVTLTVHPGPTDLPVTPTPTPVPATPPPTPTPTPTPVITPTPVPATPTPTPTSTPLPTPTSPPPPITISADINVNQLVYNAQPGDTIRIPFTTTIRGPSIIQNIIARALLEFHKTSAQLIEFNPIFD